MLIKFHEASRTFQMETNKGNRDSSLPQRTDAEQKIATEKMDNQFERLVVKKIKISDVLKMLRNRSVEDNQCAVMSSYSNELLQYLIDRVNNKQSEKIIDDKHLNALRKFALTLHFYSPQTYSNLRNKFDLCLPNRRIISQWHLRSTSAPGITLQSLEKLKSLDSDNDSFICLSFYECRIREYTERDSDRHHGYVNVGNDLYGDFVEIANEALVVTAKSFSSFWELPIAYFFGRNFSGTQKAVLLKLCIDALTFQNIRVGCVIVDGTPTNVNMASVLGANVVIPPYVPHFTYKGDKYYLIIKPSFLSKLAKNLFATERLLFHENEMIDYKYVVNYFMKKYTFDERQITDRELWNNVTATGIEFVQKESQSQNINCIPTVTFIRNFSNLLCFCRSITNPWRRRCDAASRRECCRLCNYIRSIQLSDGDFVVDSPRTLAFSGSLYNVHALERLYADYILSGKLKYILPYDCPPISLAESHFDLSRLSDYITARQVSCLYNQFLYCCGVYKSKEEEAYDLHFPPLLRAVTESSVSITPHVTEQSGDMRGRS